MIAFIKELSGRYSAHRVSRSAAELAYYLLFAVFPLLIFISSAIGRLNLSESDLYERLSLVLPKGVLSLISDYLTYARAGSEINKTFFMYAGSVLALYMLFRAVTSLNHAVRRAAGAQPCKNTVKIVMSLGISFVLIVILGLILVLLSISENLYGILGKLVGTDIRIAADLIRFAAGPAVIFFVLWMYYYFISEKKYGLKSCAVGAAVSALLWYCSAVIFAAYFNNVVDVGLLYGSLGSFILLLLWIHLTGTVIILGSEFTAVLKDKKG